MFFSACSRALLIASFAISVAACGGGGDSGGTTTPPGPAANVGISSSSFTFVAIGASQAVSATVTDASGKPLSGASLSWISDDPTVAEVNASGNTATIVARKSGATTVHATSGNASAGISITVLGVKSIALSSTSVTLRAGAEQTLTADVTTDAGVSRSVNWTSSNSSVASVSALGVVSAVAPGTATITATAVADAGKTATADVTVLAARGVVVTPAATTLGSGDTKQLTADVIVDAGLPTTVTWSTSASSIATVSNQGLVTGVALGTATITATSTADGTLQGTAQVTVAPVVRQVVITPPSSSSLFLGQTTTLVATVTADAGLAQTVNWSTSNSAVAIVSTSGVVSAVSAGSVVITATSTADATKSASVAFTTASQPVSVSLSPSALTLTAGNTSTVVATVSGDPGVSTAVTWSSAAPNIATVSNGVVTAVSNGTTTITATSVADPAKSATLSVSVGARLASSWTSTGLAGPMIENIVSTYVAGPSDVFAVNSRGDVFHFNGASWLRTAQGSAFGTTFEAVHGSSGSNVVAVGTGGKIVVFNGTSWQAMSSGTTTDLNDVWVESATSAFAVGNNGVAVRLTGSTWAVTPTAVFTEQLNSVWAAGNNIWFSVGTNGTLLRFSNGAWARAVSPTSVNLRDVFGNANNDVYAVGEVGTVVWFNGGEWSLVQSNGVSSDLYSVTGTTLGGTKVYIAGDRVALQIQNGVLDPIGNDPPYSVQFLSTAIDASGTLWMGGERGLLLRYSGSAWETMNLAPDLIDVWSTSTTNAWAVGEFGFIYRFNGSGWTRQTSPTLSRLNTVWGTSATDAFAGGDAGIILRWNGSTWNPMATPTSADILSLWGSSSTNVYATTYDGEVLRYNGSTWSIVTTQANPLYSVFGTSATDVYASGDNGSVLRFNGSSWAPMTTGTNALLAGIWGSAPNNLFSVGVLGSSAASFRFTTSWQAINVGISAELTSVWGPSASDLYVSGASGSILRFDGSTWQAMPTGTTEYLWALTGDPAGLGAGFAVGFNSTLVTGAGLSGIRASRAVAAKFTIKSLEPSREALLTRKAARALPQGAARRSARLTHARRLQLQGKAARR